MPTKSSTQEREILIDDELSPEDRFEMEMLTEVTDEITFYPEDELCFSRDDHDDCNGYFRFFTDVDGNFYYFLYQRENWEEEWENTGHEINIAGANENLPEVAQKVRDYMIENDTEDNKLYIEGRRGIDFFYPDGYIPPFYLEEVKDETRDPYSDKFIPTVVEDTMEERQRRAEYWAEVNGTPVDLLDIILPEGYVSIDLSYFEQ